MEKKHESWRVILMIGCAFPLLYFGFYLNISTLLSLIFLGLISILYSIPIKNKTLRKISGLKIIWIAMVWSLACMLPWLDNLEINFYVILMQMIGAFCFVVGITIPFDIRDLALDDNKLGTIPQIFGKRNSLIISYIILIFSLLNFFIVNDFNFNAWVTTYLVVTIVAISLVSFMNSISSKWFTAFWIEGLSGMLYIIYLLI